MKVFDQIERASLINDAFSLSRANLMNASHVLELVNYLKEDFDFLPWLTFLKQEEFFGNMIDTTAYYSEYRDFLLNVFDPIYKKIDSGDITSWLHK